MLLRRRARFSLDRSRLQKAQPRMNDEEEHDGEREVRDRDRPRSRSFAEDQPEPTAKLVPVEGSGLSGPFIRRPVMTVLVTLSVIVAGLATYGKLAVNDLPAVDYPVIQVTCSYPGADPTTMANNIATPLEKQFLQIPGLDIITSTSTQSNTSLTLQFVLSKSITDAATDVQAAIQRATGRLPIDLPSPPTFTKTDRKSTRLNSSHTVISYAVFCLKKK